MQLIHKQKKTTAAHDISEFENFRVLRVASLGIGGIFAIVMSLVVYFIYLNIFDTITRVHSILILSQEYGTDVIDFPLYEQVKKGWQVKNAPRETTPLPRNVFSGKVPEVMLPAPQKPGGQGGGGTGRSL